MCMNRVSPQTEPPLRLTPKKRAHLEARLRLRAFHVFYQKAFRDEPDPVIRSRFYGSNGETLDYVYEVDGDTVTIWAGDIGSPAYYRGEFSADGLVIDGSWAWPGGGYHAVSTRTD